MLLSARGCVLPLTARLVSLSPPPPPPTGNPLLLYQNDPRAASGGKYADPNDEDWLAHDATEHDQASDMELGDYSFIGTVLIGELLLPARAE